MRFGVVPAASLIGMVFALLISFGIPIGLIFVAQKKYKANPASFFIGAGTFVVFALVLEQLLHTGVVKLVGGVENLKANVWLYALYGAGAAAVFEETGRLLAMKFLMKKRLDRGNALMYGAGHGGIEAMILIGLLNINNLIYSIAINTNTIGYLLASLDNGTKRAVYEQLTPLWTTSSGAFFAGGAERISAIIAHIAMSFFIYKGVKFCKKRFVVLAYAYHFLLDFVTVVLSRYTSILVMELAVFAVAVIGIVLAYLLNKDEEVPIETEGVAEPEPVETVEPEVAETVEAVEPEVAETVEAVESEVAETVETVEPEVAETVEAVEPEGAEIVETVEPEAAETVEAE